MPQGDFLWCDLSTFHPAQTRAFYRDLMGWSLPADDYAIASRGGQPVAGIYEMPQKFQKIGMPSFWMSYIAVDNVEATIEIARTHGGKVELGPEPFEGGGSFALIRDPLGAGFTVYQGRALDGALTGRGGRVGHGLFVSDAQAVMPFYTALFGWHFESKTTDLWRIRNGGRDIAHLHQIPDETIRGKEQYWAVFFDTPPNGAQNVTRLGGTILAQTTLPEGPATIARDPDGGTFFMIDGAQDTAQGSQIALPRHWRAMAGLGLIALAILTGWGWISALFFAIWTATALRDGMAYLLEPVACRESPLLYWLITGSYGALAVLSLFS